MTDDLAEMQAAYRITWSLFIALEHGDQDTIDAICDESDESTLLKGWDVVAKRLRQALQEHAVECYCGSDEWLEQELIHLAEGRGDGNP